MHNRRLVGNKNMIRLFVLFLNIDMAFDKIGFLPTKLRCSLVVTAGLELRWVNWRPFVCKVRAPLVPKSFSLLLKVSSYFLLVLPFQMHFVLDSEISLGISLIFEDRIHLLDSLVQSFSELCGFISVLRSFLPLKRDFFLRFCWSLYLTPHCNCLIETFVNVCKNILAPCA